MTDADNAYAVAERMIAEAKKTGGNRLDFDTHDTRALTHLPPKIAYLPALQSLSLARTNITDEGLWQIKDLVGLTNVDLRGTPITDAGLIPIKDMIDIKILFLGDTHITDFGLLLINTLIGLSQLDLRNTQITDHGLAAIAATTTLTTLDLGGTKITDEGLTHITGMSELTGLYLSNTQISDFGLAKIQGLTTLRTLYLRNTQITDAGLGFVTSLTGLTKLDLNNTQIMDLRVLRGFEKLATNPFLGGLQIKGTAAARADARIAEIAEIEDAKTRARALFDLIDAGWVPPELRIKTANAQDIDPVFAEPNPFVFLSYATHNRSVIAGYHSFFGEQNIPLWWDQDIPVGGAWRGSIAAQLAAAKAVLTFWDAQSVASTAVIEEASNAQRAGKLLHVRLDDAPLPYGFGETQYVDLRDWDGTDQHAAMRKLLQAIHDKLSPPSAAQLAKRIHRASPMALVAKSGKLTPKDTPVNVPPPIDNRPELDDRIEGLQQSIQIALRKLEVFGSHQLHPDVAACLEVVNTVLRKPKLSWHAINDARASVLDALDLTADMPPTTLSIRVYRIVKRLSELEPYVRPAQLPPDAANAKPADTEPTITKAQLSDAIFLADNLDDVLHSPEASDVLDEDAREFVQTAIEQVRSNRLENSPEAKFARVRRGIKSIAYFTGALGAAVGTGVIVNLLTAPEAALILAARLKPILEAVLKLFL